jgi:hypothetical protein
MRQFREFERASGAPQHAPRSATPSRRKRRELAVFGTGIAIAAPSPPPPPPRFVDAAERRHDAAVAAAVRAGEFLLFTVTFYANLAHSLTRSP